MKKYLLLIWILTTLCSNSTFANPNDARLFRTISLELKDPRLSFDANTSSWQSINALIAFGGERLDSYAGKSKMARAGLFAGALYFSAMLRYYSHEVAHEVAYRASGLPVSNSLDWQHWKSTYIPGLYYPAWRQTSLDPMRLDGTQLLSSITAGLNQDELNSAAVWRSVLLRGEYSVFDAQAFLLTSLRDIDYIARARSEESPFAMGMEVHQLQRDVFSNFPQLYDDVNLYRLMLLNNGIDVSNTQLLYQSLFVSALSWHTWESIYTIFDYFVQGRSATPFHFHLSQKATVSPPLFSNYWGAQGSFINSSSMLSLGKQRFQLQAGAMLGFSKSNTFSRWRIGIKAYDIALNQHLAIQPFLFFNLQRMRHLGVSNAGVDGLVLLKNDFGIWFRMKWNADDILENEIKMNASGIHMSIGLRARI